MEAANHTFTLNLAEFRDEYKSPISYLDDTTRSTLSMGVIVCVSIVAAMLFANWVVTVMGWDADTKMKRSLSSKLVLSREVFEDESRD